MTLSKTRVAVLMTSVVAFMSILVAGLLALRLDRTRDTLRAELRECSCCLDQHGAAQ